MVKFTHTRWLPFVFALLMSLPAMAQQSRVKVQSALNTTALRPGQDGLVAIVLDIAKGFHAQSNTPTGDNLPTAATMKPAAGLEFSAPVYPLGLLKEYPALGKLNVYDGRAIIYVPLKVKADAPAGPVKLAGTIS